jgi:hypothetical protein
MKTLITTVLINAVLLTATSTTQAQRYYGQGNGTNNNQGNNTNYHNNHNDDNNNHHNNNNNHNNNDYNHTYNGSYGVYNGGTNSGYPVYNTGCNNGGVYTNYPVINVNMGYGNFYYRNEAKSILRATKYTIRQAQDVSYYNAGYTPLLGLAMRHYYYAKDLYHGQNYAAAINHAQRANALANDALYELTAYNNYNGNDDNDDDYGLRKNNITANSGNERKVAPVQQSTVKPIQYTDIDKQLPATKATDAALVGRKLE